MVRLGSAPHRNLRAGVQNEGHTNATEGSYGTVHNSAPATAAGTRKCPRSETVASVKRGAVRGGIAPCPPHHNSASANGRAYMYICVPECPPWVSGYYCVGYLCIIVLAREGKARKGHVIWDGSTVTPAAFMGKERERGEGCRASVGRDACYLYVRERARRGATPFDVVPPPSQRRSETESDILW